MYHDEIIFDFFGVWRLFTPNVLISILLANAFPLSLLVFRFKNVVHNNYLILAWFNLLIAIVNLDSSPKKDIMHGQFYVGL